MHERECAGFMNPSACTARPTALVRVALPPALSRRPSSPPPLAAMKLTIPHSLLARDNERIGGMVRGKLLLSKKYRERKDAMHLFAMAQVKKEDLLDSGKLRLKGTAYWPDLGKRDLMYFVKALHDALEGVVYRDDCQLVDIHYVFGGVDRQRPRIELEIERIADEDTENAEHE